MATVTNLLGEGIEVVAGDWVVVPGDGSDTDWGRVVDGTDGLEVAWQCGSVRTSLPLSGIAGVYALAIDAEAAYEEHITALDS